MVWRNPTGCRRSTLKRNPFIAAISRSVGEAPALPKCWTGFPALLALAYFRDSQFTEALRKFEEALARAPLSEDLYQAMSGMLFKAELIPEAEAADPSRRHVVSGIEGPSLFPGGTLPQQP